MFCCGALCLVRDEMFFDLATQVGRIMMNLRGLIMDDPEHTLHLQALQFNTLAHIGEDIDEG
jgi:hypothetical protein